MCRAVLAALCLPLAVLCLGCGPSGSPERAVEQAMSAFARLDAVGMAYYLCADDPMQGTGLQRRMAEARRQGASVRLSGMRYELVERRGHVARVRMTGMLHADHPAQGPGSERLDAVVRCVVEQGRWKVCGELLSGRE